MILLIADEDDLVGKVISDIQALIGLTPILVDEAQKAFEVIDTLQPTLAIVGLRLGDGMTGPGLARELGRRGVPTIICSDIASPREYMDGVPVAAYLKKPIDRIELLTTMKKVLDGMAAPNAGRPSSVDSSSARSEGIAVH